MHHYDLIIRNGTVLTFEPEPLFSKSDIGILEGKIAFLGSLPPESQSRETEIDASGLVVSPGFIDFHSHVDCNFLTARQLVLQGATTTIGGKRNFDGKLINKISEEGFLLNHGFFLSQSFTLRPVQPLRSGNEQGNSKNDPAGGTFLRIWKLWPAFWSGNGSRRLPKRASGALQPGEILS